MRGPIEPLTGRVYSGNGSHPWPHTGPTPTRNPIPPAPAVVIAGSALFVCWLVGSLIGWGAVHLAEWVMERRKP